MEGGRSRAAEVSGLFESNVCVCDGNVTKQLMGIVSMHQLLDERTDELWRLGLQCSGPGSWPSQAHKKARFRESYKRSMTLGQ